MIFQAAYNYMKRGYKITLPEWNGYWYWSKEKGTIIIHARGEIEFDIRETDEVDYAINFTFRDDWELVLE